MEERGWRREGRGERVEERGCWRKGGGERVEERGWRREGGGERVEERGWRREGGGERVEERGREEEEEMTDDLSTPVFRFFSDRVAMTMETSQIITPPQTLQHPRKI